MRHSRRLSQKVKDPKRVRIWQEYKASKMELDGLEMNGNWPGMNEHFEATKFFGRL